MTPDEELAELRRAAEADLRGVGYTIRMVGGPADGDVIEVKELPLLRLYPAPMPSLAEMLANADTEPTATLKVCQYRPSGDVDDNGFHMYHFDGIR